MALFRRKREAPPKVRAVQLRKGEGHPFHMLEGYIPLRRPEFSLYRSIREAVPIIDAAILKLVRLSGGMTVSCRDKQGERALQQFLKTVQVGWNQQGIQVFLDSYIDSLLTYGRSVGEMVMEPGQGEIAAVLCGDVSDVEVKENGSPLDFVLGLRKDGEVEELPYQELLLFTPYQPSPTAPYGVSLLHSMPFLSNILLKIYQTLGMN